MTTRRQTDLSLLTRNWSKEVVPLEVADPLRNQYRQLPGLHRASSATVGITKTMLITK